MAGSIARRYSTALMGLCDRETATNAHQKVAKDLGKVNKALADNEEVRKALTSPQVDTATKKKVFGSIGKSLFLGPLTKNFLYFVADKQRTDQLEAIAADFERRLDERHGRIKAHVTTAVPLNPVEKTKIQKALEKASGKKITLEASVDPALVGGVVTRIGDIVLDGSVRNQLDRMKAQLLDAVQ